MPSAAPSRKRLTSPAMPTGQRALLTKPAMPSARLATIALPSLLRMAREVFRVRGPEPAPLSLAAMRSALLGVLAVVALLVVLAPLAVFTLLGVLALVALEGALRATLR